MEYRHDEAKKNNFWKPFWRNEEHARKSLSRRDVSTSRRHQVTTWGSTNTEVNYSPRRDVTTSRRHHVATSPRRDVTTSRRHHVATSPRRDVSSKICISSLNARGLGILGHGRTCGQRYGISEPATQTSRISLDFCIGFFFIVLIIFGSHEDVIHITYFVSFLHDVLNLFLGLHQTLSQTMD